MPQTTGTLTLCPHYTDDMVGLERVPRRAAKVAEGPEKGAGEEQLRERRRKGG